jgi:ectoine hydroxylase-related dioxygenase (phytanoyl-CoA dioxygenase family)
MAITQAASAPVGSAVSAMTQAQRAQFERDGFLLVRGALSGSEVAYFSQALDRVYAAQQAAGQVASGGPMHLLSAVANCREATGLIDHPAAFPLVWSVLGWNVHIYHSHLDVHPPIRARQPYRFKWHQDGGRQNRELDGEPRPRMSVKLGYWLSDVSVPGRGNLKIIPGSHSRNWIAGPPRPDVEWPEPEGSIELCTQPGDAVFFDRRLWHARSGNYSEITRKAVFFGYAPRWIAMRDENADLLADAAFEALCPVRRQLLGGVGLGITGQAEGDHRWGYYPQTTPLYKLLEQRGQLIQDYPPLRP